MLHEVTSGSMTGRNLARSMALSRVKFTGEKIYNSFTLWVLTCMRKPAGIGLHPGSRLHAVISNIPRPSKGGVSYVE